MRTIMLSLVLLCLSTPQAAWGDEGRIGGMAFTLGFESYPGKLHYRLDGVRYISGTSRDFRFNPVSEDIAFKTLSLRATKLMRTGLGGLWAGLEVGIALPVYDYRKSWDLPALTPKLTQDVYFPSFC